MKFEHAGVITEPASTVENERRAGRTRRAVIEPGAPQNELARVAGYCPDGAFFKDERGTYQLDDRYCSGCGVCATESESKKIHMEDEHA
ncbi:hypothetical protein COT72_02965 [archaeon CG10_big_fil_rev_8_21_14_0_10_43_11]|nr:MAG: hypothetical protein COT72_02965 [archaeon CG10_big_fil_rev_8_21_14_0_10_43_11]